MSSQLKDVLVKILEYVRPAGEFYYAEATPADLFVDTRTVIPLGQVEFHTEDDGNVCPECDPLDGETYNFNDDLKPLIPIHPNCRCHYRYVDTDEVIHFSGSYWEGY